MTDQQTDRRLGNGDLHRPEVAGGARSSRHGPVAQLLIAWAPLSAILVAYATAQWINAPLSDWESGGGANRLGFDLHVAGPAHVDEAIFGRLPSVWLQQRLVDGSTHWYDAVAALVYITHFLSIPVVTGFAWFRMQDRFAAWIASVLALTLVGMAGYVLYPAAPPWLGSQLGAVGSVERISRFGWHYLDMGGIAQVGAIGQADSNPVAAMPSLHAGAALLVATFLWPMVSKRWRGTLLVYVGLMALTLVYTGEHYVVDVVAGWFTAAVATAVGALVQRRVMPRRAARPSSLHRA